METMSGPDDGGHASPDEQNPWWKFGGSVQDTGEDGNKGKYVDPNFTAFHDIPDYLNSQNQKYGWTDTANNANINKGAAVQAEARAGQAEHLAQNAEMMGNDEAAARFAARGEEMSTAASDFEALSEQRGTLNAIFENPAMKIGGNVAGAALGGLSMYNGWDEIQHGKTTQGAADMTAGGIGVVGGLAGAGGAVAEMAGATALAGTLGTVGAVAAPVGIVAGLAALGNGESQKLGVWDWMGKNKDGSSMDSIQMVGRATSGAYNATDNAVEGALGNHWYSSALGKTAGVLAGTGAAVGSTAMGLVTDVGLGAYDVGKGVVNGASWVGNKVGQGASWLGGEIGSGAQAIGSGIANGASAVGNGIASGAKAIGSGVANVASSVGSGIASGAKAVGSGISSAAKSVGNFVSHLW